MNAEKLNRLYEIYSTLYEEKNISNQQENVYHIQFFLHNLDNMLISDTINKLDNIIDDNVINALYSINAISYFNLFKKIKDELDSPKKETYENFLCHLQDLLNSDNLIENYLYEYIKNNSLDQDLNFYDDFTAYNQAKGSKIRAYKKAKTIWILLLASLITFYYIPISLVLIDFGADGNSFNLYNTSINIVTFLICSLILITLHIYWIRKKISKTIFKVLLDFGISISILLICAFIPQLSCIINGISIFIMSCPACVILLNVKDSLIAKNNLIKNHYRFSDLYNKKAHNITYNNQNFEKQNIQEKKTQTQICTKFAPTDKASLIPSTTGIIISALIILGAGIYIVFNYKKVVGLVICLAIIMLCIYSMIININVLKSRIKINKTNMPEYFMDYHPETQTFTIDLLDGKKEIAIKDIDIFNFCRLFYHSYKFNGIQVRKDIVDVIIIELKQGDPILLYFVKNPAIEVQKLSDLIANI